MIKALLIIGGAIVLVLAVVLVLWRKAAARAIELEAAKLAESFKREAEREATAKKQRIEDQRTDEHARIDAMTPEQLEREYNE
jgi:FtsZ-interacting cell division protein ZipA